MIILDWFSWLQDYDVERETDEDQTPIDIGYNDPRIRTHPQHIWCQLDVHCCDDFPACECPDEPNVFNGAHLVNRLAYFYSEVPWAIHEDIGVI